MSNIVRITADHNEYRLAGSRDRFDVGTGNFRIQLRTGSKPTNVGDAATGTLIAVLEFTKPCGTIASNVLTLTTLSDAVALADGTPGYARWIDGNGVIVADSDVGSLASDAPVRINPTTLVTGALIEVVSATLV